MHFIPIAFTLFSVPIVCFWTAHWTFLHKPQITLTHTRKKHYSRVTAFLSNSMSTSQTKVFWNRQPSLFHQASLAVDSAHMYSPRVVLSLPFQKCMLMSLLSCAFRHFFFSLSSPLLHPRHRRSSLILSRLFQLNIYVKHNHHILYPRQSLATSSNRGHGGPCVLGGGGVVTAAAVKRATYAMGWRG